MSTSNIHQRFSEVAAVANASMVLRQLDHETTAPNGKAFARQREKRLALWQQVAEIAYKQVDALSAAPPVKRRALKPRATEANGAAETSAPTATSA